MAAVIAVSLVVLRRDILRTWWRFQMRSADRPEVAFQYLGRLIRDDPGSVDMREIGKTVTGLVGSRGMAEVFIPMYQELLDANGDVDIHKELHRWLKLEQYQDFPMLVDTLFIDLGAGCEDCFDALCDLQASDLPRVRASAIGVLMHCEWGPRVARQIELALRDRDQEVVLTGISVVRFAFSQGRIIPTEARRFRMLLGELSRTADSVDVQEAARMRLDELEETAKKPGQRRPAGTPESPP